MLTPSTPPLKTHQPQYEASPPPSHPATSTVTPQTSCKIDKIIYQLKTLFFYEHLTELKDHLRAIVQQYEDHSCALTTIQ
jgi:hypothetical protein